MMTRKFVVGTRRRISIDDTCETFLAAESKDRRSNFQRGNWTRKYRKTSLSATRKPIWLILHDEVRMNEMNCGMWQTSAAHVRQSTKLLPRVSDNGFNFFIVFTFRSIEVSWKIYINKILDKNTDDVHINVPSGTINLALEISFTLHGIHIIAS